MSAFLPSWLDDAAERMLAEQAERAERLHALMLQPIEPNDDGFVTFTVVPDTPGPVSTGLPPEV